MRHSEIIKKDIVQFLRLCITYTDDSLERKLKRIESLTEPEIQKTITEIEKWKTYKQFTEHTIDELLNGELDKWIENLHDSEFDPSPE